MAVKRGIIIRLIAMAIGIPLGLCGVMVTLWLLIAFDFQPWTLFVTALLWMGAFCIAWAIFAGVIRRRRSKLDALFVPLGLEGKVYMSWFRQYHGTAHGH